MANVTAFDISRSKKTKKKLVLGLSNHHLIDVGAGCTTSLPETLLRRGKFTWLKYDEIVKSLLEYVEKSVILRSIEIYSGMLRCIEIYGDVLRLYDSIDPSIFLETTSSHLDVDCYFVAWMQKMKPRVALRRYPAVVEAINQLTNQTNNQPTNHGSPKYHNISGEQMYKYMEI